jgi:DNA-binding transcriptional ArsR family regulator
MVTISTRSGLQFDDAQLDDAQLDRLFSALGDRTRRAILARLGGGPATVGALAEPFAMSRPAISKHLNVLETAGLVERLPDGRMTRCRLDPAGLETAHGWLDRYRSYWEASLNRLVDYLENEQSPDASSAAPDSDPPRK